MAAIKCPHCGKCSIDFGQEKCPYCDKLLRVSEGVKDIFNKLFGEEKCNNKKFNKTLKEYFCG